MAVLTQVARYGVVGVLNNLLGYLIYLLVTWLWLDPKVAVTLLYPVGALTAYFGHAKYSFSYSGSTPHGVLRYVIAHLIGYSVNVLMLYVLSDRLLFPHQIIQALAIVVVAGVLFLLFRYFVFPNHSPAT
ncbi:MAG: GtrA family protein [Rhodoferax sp.]|uniref:GtrA family protein n=1 Tax=Rhodoferax sp. TaxID=50421 RepID=UPI00262D9B06|nr:GtrA family protein [Rhodoferax sp.]MDD2882880.1 GtrA family protein [Rhodoferax sp.]